VTSLFGVLLGLDLSLQETLADQTFQSEVVDIGELVAGSGLSSQLFCLLQH